jgi:hypothetical protein
LPIQRWLTPTVRDLYADGDTVITHIHGAATPKDDQP